MRPDVLYHYCSLESFLSIINNKALRLSDITKSNDIHEIEFLWTACKEHINGIKGSATSFDYFADQQLKKTVFLVSCFSKNSDSPYMWNSYATNGVAIGFDSSLLENWINSILVCNGKLFCFNHTVCDSNNGIAFSKVYYYDKNEVMECAEEMFKRVEYSTDRFGEVFRNAPFSKTNYWKEENEWRVLIWYIVDQVEPENREEYIKAESKNTVKINTQFTADKKAKLYCDVPFKKEMIKSVTLSPFCTEDIGSIRKALISCGFDIADDSIKDSIWKV